MENIVSNPILHSPGNPRSPTWDGARSPTLGTGRRAGKHARGWRGKDRGDPLTLMSLIWYILLITRTT